MRILITGAAGFIGMALQRALVHRGSLSDASGILRPIDELVLADRAQVRLTGQASFLRTVLRGDVGDTGFVAELAAQGADSVFHLAASLTLETEQDEGTAYRVNVEALRQLIAGPRRSPRLVLASSIAAFGGVLPHTVEDGHRLEPDTTYGTHKAISELLLADGSRRGLVDGRALRLPIVLIREGASSPAISDRVAAIVREPLAGRETVCGLSPETLLPVASAHAVAEALIAVHELAPSQLPHGRAMNLPALTCSVGGMVDTLRRLGGTATADRVRFEPDASMQRIVDSWPRVFASAHASTLGLRSDASFDAIVEAYLRERHQR